MYLAGIKPHMLWMARSDWNNENKTMIIYSDLDDWKYGNAHGEIVSIILVDIID